MDFQEGGAHEKRCQSGKKGAPLEKRLESSTRTAYENSCLSRGKLNRGNGVVGIEAIEKDEGSKIMNVMDAP